MVKPVILKAFPNGDYFMREMATRPTRCFECHSTRQRMYYYWVRTPKNRQESRGKFDLPFCCAEHYHKYQKRITIDSEKGATNG